MNQPLYDAEEENNQYKELSIINQTNKVFKEAKSIDEALQQICYLLPMALQYTDFAVSRIRYDGREYIYPREFTSIENGFKGTKWKLEQSFRTFGNKSGIVEVYYLKQFPFIDEGPFLAEERSIIDNVAGLIAGFLNRIKGEKLLREYSYKHDNKSDIKPERILTSRHLLQHFMYKNNSARDVYHDLMPFKVKEILLIANLYDAFSIEHEGRFFEHMLGQYHQLNLTSFPRVTGASNYEEAILQLNVKHFDLIILMMGVDKKSPMQLAQKIKRDFQYIPVFLLLNNNRDVKTFDKQSHNVSFINKVFVWNGDSKIFFTMVKYLEDVVNVDNDTKLGSARVILVVEDSAIYYSRYLPLLYTSVMEQTKRIIDDVSSDELYKVLRLRVRPKILLAVNYEQAIDIYNKHKQYLLCLITDVKFNREGKHVDAGFDLVRRLKKEMPDLPIVMQSANKENEVKAKELKTTFIHKNSESLIQDIKNFISYNLGFGDFIFKDTKNNPIAVAKTITEFENQLKIIPDDSILFHSKKNHFSLWLLARGETEIARIIHPYQIKDFEGANAIRKHLLNILEQHRNDRNKGKIIEFHENSDFWETNIVSLASGSLGGKGRGIAFINTLINSFNIKEYFQDIRIRCPRTAIIGTDEFDYFLQENNLYEKIFNESNYESIKRHFIRGDLSDRLIFKLKWLLNLAHRPLAIRSSSLFEDSLMQPFSGIFSTYILPNNHSSFYVRLQQITEAIKLVFASIYSKEARSYFEAVNYKVEEEKMAVIIQEVVGQTYDGYYYPHISGTAQSYNYYPVAHMKPDEGFALAAIGLGRYVVEGEKAFRFSPKYPSLEINSVKSQLKNTQTEFYAVDMNKINFDLLDEGEEAGLTRLELFDAEKHGTLKHSASVYDVENDRIEPGISSQGVRIINFANILKYNYIPLASTIKNILDIVKEALGAPVEIEFAVDLNKDDNGLVSFYLLQIKPMVGNLENYNVELGDVDENKIVLYTEMSMGNGKIEDICDVIYVDINKFNKLKTEEIACDIEKINQIMVQQKKNYVLIGPGRWGTSDRFIGIPVKWAQISNAKVIVESGIQDFPLDASLGSHFFHNVTSMGVGYFSIENKAESDFIAWDILYRQKVIHETSCCKHVRFANPLNIIMDGKKRQAMITL